MQTENIRRHRGNKILQALLDDIRGQTRWTRLAPNPPGIQPPPRGIYHTPTGKIDTTAGARGGPPQPRIALITIGQQPEIGYEGEQLTVTPTLYLDLHTRLSRARVHPQVREWAHMRTPSPIATYWPSRGFVAFTHYPPSDLRPALQTAVLIVGEAVPIGGPSQSTREKRECVNAP